MSSYACITSTYVVGEMKRVIIRSLAVASNIVRRFGLIEGLHHLARFPRTRLLTNVLNALAFLLRNARDIYEAIDRIEVMKIRLLIQSLHGVKLIEDNTSCPHSKVEQKITLNGYVIVSFPCGNCKIRDFILKHKQLIEEMARTGVNEAKILLQEAKCGEISRYTCLSASDLIIALIAKNFGIKTLVTLNIDDFKKICKILGLQVINPLKPHDISDITH